MISAVVLTHNSAATLSRTLKSLTWCEDLVVIDDVSADETHSIASKYTKRIYTRKLNENFAEQRNFGLEKAKGPWVLFVDSDEVVTDSLKNEIKEVVRLPCCEGYDIRRKDFIFGRWLRYGETARVRLLRLGKKKSGKWERAVHEVWKIRGTIGELTHPLEHFPHPNVAQFVEEINTYSTLNARYLFDKKVRVSWWHITAYPAGKFFMNFFVFRGFADGTAGAVVALMMSFHSFLTRAKLRLLWEKYPNV